MAGAILAATHEREVPAMTGAEEVFLADGVRATLPRHGLTGWRLTVERGWSVVAPAGYAPPVPGRRLHLAATPVSAPLILARVADVLARYRCPFGYVSVMAASTGRGRDGGGRFLTAYPQEQDVVALADELHEATLGLPGPALPQRPVRPGSLVHDEFVTETVPATSAPARAARRYAISHA